MKKIGSLLFAIVLIIISYFLLRPYSFYKSIAIRYTDETEKLIHKYSLFLDSLTVNSIKVLPKRQGTVFSIKKKERIKKQLQGSGNCSNQSVASGAILSEFGKHYQVIHPMPVPTFLEGSGHTALQAEYKDSLAIFDILGRSLIKQNNHLINYRDLDS